MTMLSRLTLALLALFAFAACGKKDPHAGHNHGGHSHTAPHGGKLVELGDHAYNLELVRDSAAGKLTAYVLDGHAENFIRIEAPSIAVIATVGGQQQTLLLRAVANPATGETVGATSQLEAQADWLKGTAAIEGVIKTLPIRGTTFSDVKFKLP